jgi:hypothetical protein
METKEILLVLNKIKSKWLIDEIIDTTYGKQGLKQYLEDSLIIIYKRWNSN